MKFSFFFFPFFNGSYSKLYTTISMHLLSNLIPYLGFNLHSVWLLRNEEKWILNSFNPNGSSRLSKVEILIFPFLMSLIQKLIVLFQFICWAMWYSIWVSNYTLFCCSEKKRKAYWTCLIGMVVVDLVKFEIFIFLFPFF